MLMQLYAPLQSNQWPVVPHRNYQYTPSIWLYPEGFVRMCAHVGVCILVCVYV